MSGVGPQHVRSQEELEALDPAPVKKKPSSPGSVASGLSSRSRVSSGVGSHSAEKDPKEYVLSLAAHKRIAMGRAQRIAQQQFQPAVRGNGIPVQMRSGRSGVRTGERYPSLYGRTQQQVAA
jgi:hypothetical protein